MLEAAQHEDNSFITLTYAADRPSLDAEHTSRWLKRLRRSFPRQIRYFLVGEYGDKSERPHYHAALFGYPNCLWGQSRYKYRKNCCSSCDLIRDTWKAKDTDNHGGGHVFLGTLEDSSAQYIAQYVTKKLTRSGDVRLNGRSPEYARMSLRPGIGGTAVWDIADSHMANNIWENTGDVVPALRHGNTIRPLGRYLTRKLRRYIGEDEKAPLTTLARMELEMQDVLEITRAGGPLQTLERFKNNLREKHRAQVTKLEARTRLYAKGRSL